MPASGRIRMVAVLTGGSEIVGGAALYFFGLALRIPLYAVALVAATLLLSLRFIVHAALVCVCLLAVWASYPFGLVALALATPLKNDLTLWREGSSYAWRVTRHLCDESLWTLPQDARRTYGNLTYFWLFGF